MAVACFLPGRAKDLSAPMYIALVFPCPHTGLAWSSSGEFAGWMIRGSKPCRGQEVSLFSNKGPDRLWGTPSLLFICYRGPFA